MNRSKTIVFAILMIECGFLFNSLAGIEPSFYLENLALQAPDIVVVTQSEKLDGRFMVIEVWKGDLKSGDWVIVPELTVFASDESRVIHRWPRDAGTNLTTHVSGLRMSLFLRKTASGSWESTDKFGGIKTSVAWIEQSQTYAFVQEMNPGPSLLVPLRLSESGMKAQVLDVIQTQDAIAKIVAITNLSQRADALKPFISSKHWFARKSAFAELGKCGDSALPVLRGMLNNESLLAQHGDVIGALGQAGGNSVAAELTTLVETETKFWKQTAPGLKQGWWNGTGIQWSEVELLRNHYTRVLEAIRVLKGLKYGDSKTAIIQLRDFWRSLPQLEDKSGLNQMSEECDGLLKAIQ